MLQPPGLAAFLLASIATVGIHPEHTPLAPLVPAVHSLQVHNQEDFILPGAVHILVEETFANSTLDNGLTLIPPTLHAFAETFAADVHELFPGTSAQVTLTPASLVPSYTGYVYLTLSPGMNTAFASGASTTEGYEIAVTADGVNITGSGAKGAFWGTRTLLQGLVQSNGRFPSSTIQDWPDWPTRGIMLDVGRHWYPIAFLKEFCAYASWFKMSEFHVHLSDNVSPNGHADAYARFRLHSDNPALAGLTPFVNETYSREEFDDFQTTCARRGVTVIPEIESPGHALVITQWKPELALSSDPTLLNLTVPETIPTVKAIWKEFLPWFHTKQVSIGADEYDADLADDYNNFVNDMSDFMQTASGKTIRIWSTSEPSNKTSVSKAIIKQHWEFFEGDPFGLIKEGYHVINSEDSIHYIVMKMPPLPGAYPERLNQTRLWDGANVDTGGIWDPHIFDRGNASNNPTIAEPLLQGSIIAVWNDHGPNASTPLEAFYAVKDGLPVIAAVDWQAASRPNHLTHAQFLQAYPVLEAHAPGQNLDRRIASKTALVARYAWAAGTPSGVRVPDTSGNGYDAMLERGVLRTPLGSKGHNYTVLISVGCTLESGVLLSGPDTSFGVTQFGGGSTLAFTSTNIVYPLLNYTFGPTCSSNGREVILVGTENRTAAWVDGKHAGDFMIGIDGTTEFQPMAFVAPVQQIHTESFTLWDGVQNISRISKSRNSTHTL
ncbi:glycoside hydrolase family 20 protein [Phanerochaete sordida]|uniref:beta-N-acetylhexosaminidase n=1 Tax=Phanerochaete sordida TaxID=48140 RepID=A0A9P3G0P9_9APHY|nr:glycoside hydrolase family 20 protein [Phanerochaete sordida]